MFPFTPFSHFERSPTFPVGELAFCFGVAKFGGDYRFMKTDDLAERQGWPNKKSGNLNRVGASHFK
jgi:hypothetical protein